MSEEFWLRAINVGAAWISDAASEPMQLVVLFKPSLLSVALRARTSESADIGAARVGG
jgi:hypothetical protein